MKFASIAAVERCSPARRALRSLALATAVVTFVACSSGGEDAGNDPQAPVTYTLTFDGNGASGTPPTAVVLETGQTTTAPGAGALVETGSTFANWNTAANGSADPYDTGDTITVGNADQTFYAQWTPIPYSVTYDGNGNTGGSAPTDGATYEMGDPVIVLAEGTLVKTGEVFSTWNTADDGSGTDYAPSDSMTMPASDVTLYAQWVPPTYNVLYDGNGSDAGAAPVDPTDYLAGATVTVSGESTLTKVGESFTGWNTAANGSGTAYVATDTFAMPSADVTLYAQWAAPASITATPGDSQVSLAWAPVVGATAYNVYYHTADDQGAATLWNTTVGLIVNEAATVHGLTNSTPYFFWVGGVTPGGENLVLASSVTATPDAGVFSPDVTTIEPGENALEVALDKKVIVYFNQALDGTTVNTTNVTVTDGTNPVTVTVALGGGGDSIEIDPQSGTWAEGTTHTVTLGTGILSGGGDPLAAAYSFSFTTLSNASLLGRWTFNNDGTDVSGNSLDATVTGATYDSVSLHEGTHSLALTSGSVVDIGVVDLGQQFTYTAWVNVNGAASSIQTLFGNGSAGFATNGIKVFVNEWNTTNGKIVIESGNGLVGQQIMTDPNFVTFGDWFHVAVAIDRPAGECSFYFNGIEATTYDSITGLPSILIRNDFDNNAQTYLNQFGDGNFDFNGSQDDVRFYNRVLTAAEIANIANEN